MGEPIKLTPPEIYSLLLQHPGMQHGNPPPTLVEFQSWDPVEQQATLDAFAHFNPGIWLETMHDRRIAGFRTVDDGKDQFGDPINRHEEIIYGESMNLIPKKLG